MLPNMEKELERCDYVEDLEMGRVPSITRWAQCNHKGLYEREIGGSKSEKEMMEAEIGMIWGHKLKKLRQLLGAEADKEKDSPLHPPERIQTW